MSVSEFIFASIIGELGKSAYRDRKYRKTIDQLKPMNART